MYNNEAQEVSIAGTLSFNEYKKFNIYHRRKFEILYFILMVIVLYFVFQAIFSDFQFVSGLLFTLTMALIGTIIRRYILFLRVRREFSSDKMIKDEVKYFISSDGINQQRNRSSNYIEWNEIIKVYEYNELFLLFVSNNRAVILPKRFFDSNDDIICFKEVIRQNINKDKLKIKF